MHFSALLAGAGQALHTFIPLILIPTIGNTTTTIDSIGETGKDTSIAIGTDGYPIIVYYDDTNNDLKVAKQLGLPKTAISYFNRYIKTDGQIKISRNMLSGTISGGPNDPSAAANDSSYGTIAWSNPTNVYTSNGSDATAGLPQDDISNYLKATGFNFSIPGGAIIEGITVEFEKADAGFIRDSRVRIVKGGVIGSTDRADTVTYWPDSDEYVSHGNSTDLWGEEWTAVDINDSNFGVAISAVEASGVGLSTAYIDHIRITVDCRAPALYLESSPFIRICFIWSSLGGSGYFSLNP